MNSAPLGHAPRRPLTVGQVARFLRVPTERVRYWVRVGWLHPLEPNTGRGRPVRLPPEEYLVAARAQEIATRYRTHCTEGLFAHARTDCTAAA